MFCKFHWRELDMGSNAETKLMTLCFRRLKEITERKRGDSQCFLKTIHGQSKGSSIRWTLSRIAADPNLPSENIELLTQTTKITLSLQSAHVPVPGGPLDLHAIASVNKMYSVLSHSIYYSAGWVQLIVGAQVTYLCLSCKGNWEIQNAALFRGREGGAWF